VLVAIVGRAAAISLAAVRRARQREIGVLLRSSERMGRSLDLEDVAREAVRVAAGTLVTHGRRGIRQAVLLRGIGERAVVIASHDDTGATARAGTDRPILLEQLPPVVHQALTTGRPGLALSADLAPELRDLSARVGAGAWAVAGVQVAGEPFGV